MNSRLVSDAGTRPVTFRMGWSTITGVGHTFHPHFPHVLKVAIHTSRWHRAVATLLSWLPPPLQRLAWWLWPRYTLPDCVVVKKLRTLEHIEAFQNEQAVYRKLAPLQGDLIPRFYGEALVGEGNDDDDDDDNDSVDGKYRGKGTRASVISFMPWPILLQQPEPVLTVDDFQARIEVAVDAIMAHGIVYIDPKLDNVMLRDDGRIVFIDLEMTDEVEPGKEPLQRWFTVVAFVDNYKRFLRVRAADRGEPLPPAPGLSVPPPDVKALLPPRRPRPPNAAPALNLPPREHRSIPVPSADELARLLGSPLTSKA
ncbi:Protein kinase-like domain protein [Niveomyces insectorum RCEF 264]|uniref:Protein kinase-like domain protein n=1 Tax=Niveomyces insectorum RCEF 264 TaxID=1081102 RepID=A0A167X314_9HYPO|nr:Protein kinase-like domain protein [Niveomyces insectorum RCEF 264]